MSEKLTPAKRLKQLKYNGWLEFVEFAESTGLTPRSVCQNYVGSALDEFKFKKISIWLGEDIEHDLYNKDTPCGNVYDSKLHKMLGLSEQLANPCEGSYPKSKKNNKITQRFKKNGESL